MCLLFGCSKYQLPPYPVAYVWLVEYVELNYGPDADLLLLYFFFILRGCRFGIRITDKHGEFERYEACDSLVIFFIIIGNFAMAGSGRSSHIGSITP